MLTKPTSARAAAAMAGVASVLFAVSSDVVAAPLSAVVTSVGPMFALGALFVAKAHASASLKAAGGAFALSAFALLTWRALRGAAVPNPLALLRRGAWMPARTPAEGVGPGADRLGVLTAKCSLPAGVDAHCLTTELRENFVRLQASWDAGDIDALARLTTPDMLDELLQQLSERGGRRNRTEILSLKTVLLSYERRDAADLACVEFFGTIRESDESAGAPFAELWMLVRPHAPATCWKLARQQALL